MVENHKRNTVQLLPEGVPIDDEDFEPDESEEDQVVAMSGSLFVLPEEFEGETLENALRDAQDQEVLYVAGDLLEDVVLEEDEAAKKRKQRIAEMRIREYPWIIRISKPRDNRRDRESVEDEEEDL